MWQPRAVCARAWGLLKEACSCGSTSKQPNAQRCQDTAGDVSVVALSVLPARPFHSELVVRALHQNLRYVSCCSRLAGRLDSGADCVLPRIKCAAVSAFVNDLPRVLVTNDKMLPSCHSRPVVSNGTPPKIMPETAR